MRSKRSRKAVSYVYEANDENTDEEDIVPYNPKRSKKTDTRVVKLHALKKIVRDEEDQSSVPDSETYQDCKTLMLCWSNVTESPNQPFLQYTIRIMIQRRKDL